MCPRYKASSIRIPSWKEAVQLRHFKTKLIVAGLLFIAILIAFPYFFQYIEARNGYSLSDIVVEHIPAADCSLPIFLCIWGITLLMLIRCVKQPYMLLTGLYSFIILTLFRITTITLIPLNPPAGLIPLVDPISNFFYGKTDFVTKDLFFSGHTSSQFLYFLCLQKKSDKLLALLSTIIVGSLVLVQHVHYTIDVVAAIPLTYLCYLAGRRVAGNRSEFPFTA
jgi:hypothetical protein